MEDDMTHPTMVSDVWQERIREACALYRLGPLSNLDAMLLALCLAACPADEWPTPRWALVDAVADLDQSLLPTNFWCEAMLNLADSPAFDGVIAMFDLVRAYDRSHPSSL
jgi:hypothetical protein